MKCLVVKQEYKYRKSRACGRAGAGIHTHIAAKARLTIVSGIQNRVKSIYHNDTTTDFPLGKNLLVTPTQKRNTKASPTHPT
jgi:hypothetical protein